MTVCMDPCVAHESNKQEPNKKIFNPYNDQKKKIK